MEIIMKKTLVYTLLAATLLTSTSANAEKYQVDVEGAHAFIQFKIKHLGYSWLHGRFNTFDGEFDIDRDNLENSKIAITIDPASVDSNHAERDKHIRGAGLLEVEKYPEASFTSTSLKLNGEKAGVLTGDLTLHGVTKSVDIAVNFIGEGKDPWGGYRLGLEGTTSLTLKDYGIYRDLGPASATVDMILSIEGIRK
jgi:polyisoprenoid-binding protein YceI